MTTLIHPGLWTTWNHIYREYRYLQHFTEFSTALIWIVGMIYQKCKCIFSAETQLRDELSPRANSASAFKLKDSLWAFWLCFGCCFSSNQKKPVLVKFKSDSTEDWGWQGRSFFPSWIARTQRVQVCGLLMTTSDNHDSFLGFPICHHATNVEHPIQSEIGITSPLLQVEVVDVAIVIWIPNPTWNSRIKCFQQKWNSVKYLWTCMIPFWLRQCSVPTLPQEGLVQQLDQGLEQWTQLMTTTCARRFVLLSPTACLHCLKSY